jgi:hypothetical protein
MNIIKLVEKYFAGNATIGPHESYALNALVDKIDTKPSASRICMPDLARASEVTDYLVDKGIMPDTLSLVSNQTKSAYMMPAQTAKSIKILEPCMFEIKY